MEADITAGRLVSAVFDWVSNPVAQTLVAMTAVSAAYQGAMVSDRAAPTPLDSPLFDPWSGAVVSVFAHTDPALLLTNLVLVAVVGGAFLRETSRARWHVFFIATGTVSALVFAWTTGSKAVAGVGASGAVAGLVTYAVSGRILPVDALGTKRYRVALGVLAGGALAFSLAARPGSGWFPAHVAGAVIGLGSGHLKLLRRD